MAVPDLQRLFDELKADVEASGSGETGGVQDITQLDYTEDSVRSYGSPITPVTVNVTNSGQTQLIAAPGAGFRLVIRYVGYSLNGSSSVACSVREAAGVDKYTQRLQAQGQAWARGFMSTEWQLTEATAFQATLSGASDVYVNVEYEVRAV